VLTILGGILLSRPGAQQFGWTALGITAFLNFVMLLLKDKMRGRNPVRNTAIVLLTGFLGILVLIGALKVVGLFGFTIGNDRTPLTWLSQFVYLALSWLGPLQKYLPYLLLLAVVLLVILMLNVAGVRTFGWLSTLLSRSGARKFKPIKLERLTKRDMKNVQRSGPDNRIMLSALARLSSSPSPGWVAQFEQNWQSLDSDNQVRVYGDVLSFICPEQEVTGVWKDLKSTVIKTNNELKQRIKQEAQDLDRLHKQQRLNQKKLETAKWSSFKDLG
jgi:hypothetical protein